MDKVIQINPEDVLTAIAEGKHVIRILKGKHTAYLSNYTVTNIKREMEKPENIFIYVEKDGGQIE